MSIYQQRIQSIAHSKVIVRGCNGKSPNLTFNGLSHVQQDALVLALIRDNETVRELISSQITNDIEDAYCDMIRLSEAIDDAIELQHLRDDISQRSRDMNQEIKGIL